MRIRFALLLLLVGFAGGVIAFLAARWTQPSEETAPTEVERHPLLADAEGARLRLAARHPKLALSAAGGSRRRPAELDLRLSEPDLRDLLLLALEGSDDGRRLLEAADEIEVLIADGELGVRIVANLSRLDRERLGEKQREVVNRVTRMLPMLAGRGIPIGVYGRPRAAAGGVRIDAPRVEIAVVKLSVETLREKLGVEPEKLSRALELQLPGYEVRDVTVAVDHLAVRLRRSRGADPAV